MTYFAKIRNESEESIPSHWEIASRATPAVLLSPRISRSTIRSEISTLLTSFNERVIIARNVHDIN